MNETEKQMMLQLMNEFYSFMKGSAGKMNFENNTIWEEIVNLDQECGNYREVFVEIYFSDGRYIQLHNRSFESLINNRYCGDDIQLIPDENGQRFLSMGGLRTCTYEIYVPMVSVSYDDPEMGQTLTSFPISSVSRISRSTKKVKWCEKWRKLSPEDMKLHETIFRNFREKYLSEQSEKKK